jgi:hypothetical protein
MPRYRYVCLECESERIVFHLYKENPLLKCTLPECEGALSRSVTKAAVMPKKTTEPSVGDLTEEFIEESKEALKQQKTEAKESTYDPS